MNKLIGILMLVQLCAISMFSSAQSPEQNLQKYWNYRDRLRKYFIAISPNDEQGTNIPALSINGTGYNTLYWGDGNGSLQYYIGLLATEYKLLKLYNLDYSVTRNELLYALKAVERLDRTAEKYFRNPQQEQTGDLNGFFIRDDVDEDILSYNSNMSQFTIRSTYTDHRNDNGYPYEQSKDNVWHYLPNLALVVNLVDDIEIKNLAINITYRMIKYMHQYTYFTMWYPCDIWEGCWPGHFVKVYNYFWKINNPVTNNEVEDGARIDEIGFGGISFDGFSYGFAEAGGWITNQNLHYGSSLTNDGYFIGNLLLAPGLYDTYSYRSLATTAGFSTLGSWDTYKFLVTRSYDDLFHPYEHFALIYSILHGRSSEFNNYYQPEFSRYEQLLNVAPECGIYNFGKNNTYNNLPPRPKEWSVDNRLVWPERLDNDLTLGYSNGIDFMLLHNLFWLAYIIPETEDIINKSGGFVPYYYINSSGIRNTFGDAAHPLILNARTKVNYSNTINSDGVVKLGAVSEINLLPGFSTVSGSLLDAQIGSHIPYVNRTYPVYKKLPSNNSCLNIP